MESYRHISLTSTVGKTMEHLVKHRLWHFAKSMHLSTEFHAGLRHGRRPTALIVSTHKWWASAISNAAWPSDTNWLLKSIWQGLKTYFVNICWFVHMVLWIQVWLSNWLTWVTLDGARSQNVTKKQGVMQWSVLSLRLILSYIDDLASAPQISLIANDIEVLSEDMD